MNYSLSALWYSGESLLKRGRSSLQLMDKLAVLTSSRNSLPCSQHPDTCPFHEPH